MQPYGAPRLQPLATGCKSERLESRQKHAKTLARIATACRSERMVRKGGRRFESVGGLCKEGRSKSTGQFFAKRPLAAADERQQQRRRVGRPLLRRGRRDGGGVAEVGRQRQHCPGLDVDQQRRRAAVDGAGVADEETEWTRVHLEAQAVARLLARSRSLRAEHE